MSEEGPPLTILSLPQRHRKPNTNPFRWASFVLEVLNENSPSKSDLAVYGDVKLFYSDLVPLQRFEEPHENLADHRGRKVRTAARHECPETEASGKSVADLCKVPTIPRLEFIFDLRSQLLL